MACPINRETIINGIRNNVNDRLINESVADINKSFGEEVVKEVEGNVTIQPSEQLISSYLSAYRNSEEYKKIIVPISEISENPKISLTQQGRVRQLLDDMGVSITNLSNITINGQTITEEGVALPLQALVGYADGREDVLPEEALHIAVEILSQTNRGLLNVMLSEITKLPIYNQVLNEYGNNPQYQKDGKPDLLKIKKEAIAKQLVLQTGQKESVKSWWKKVLDFLKGLFGKSNINLSPFQDAIDTIFNGNIGTVRNTLLKNKSYLVQQGITQDVADEIVGLANSDISDTELRLRIAQISPDIAFYSLSAKTNTVSDKLANKKINDGLIDDTKRLESLLFAEFGDTTSTPYRDTLNKFTGQDSTAIKKDLFSLLKSFVKTDNTLNNNPSFSLSYNTDFTTFSKLKALLEEKFKEFPDAKFFVQKEIGSNTDKSKVDLLVVDNKGTTHVINFFTTNKELTPLENRLLTRKTSSANKILKEGYSITSFGQNRTILLPVVDGLLVEDENDDFLDVTSRLDSTGSKAVDALLSKLRDIASKSKGSITESQLTSNLLKAIRHIQVKGNIAPLQTVVDSISRRISRILDDYSTFRNSNPSEEEIKKYAENLEKLVTLANQFKDVGSVFINIEKDNPILFKDVTKRLNYLSKKTGEMSILNDRLRGEVLTDFNQRFVADKYNISNINAAERAVQWIDKNLRSYSEAGTRAVRLMYRMWSNINRKADQDTNKEISKLQTLKEAYDKIVKDKKNYLAPIMRKDENGKLVHKLLSKYDRDRFIADVNKAVANQDFDWIKKNIDYKAYQDWYKKAKTEAFYELDDLTIHFDEDIDKKARQNRKDNWVKRFDITQNLDSKNTELYRFITDAYFSKEYKTLMQNKPAHDLYNYILDWNMRAYEAGALSLSQAESTIPTVNKETLDKLIQGGSVVFADATLRNLLTSEEQMQLQNINSETGELENKIPFYYTYASENASQDIFKILPSYVRQTVKYEELAKKEPELILIQQVEQTKKALATNTFGYAVLNKFSANNDNNTKYFNDFLKTSWYGHYNIESGADLRLVRFKNATAKKINGYLGRKVISEEEGILGLNNTVDGLNKLFQLKILGVNITIPIVNFLGSNMQALVNAGEYFRKRDFLKHEFGSFLDRFNSEEERLKTLGLVEFFGLRYDSASLEKASRDLSISKLTGRSIPEYLMAFQEASEVPIQMGIGLSMLDNFMISPETGELVSIKKYVTAKYPNRFDVSETVRNEMNRKIEEETSRLRDTKSIFKITKIENGKVVVPGLEMDSQSVKDFITLTQQLTRRATGGGNREDYRLINKTVIGRSVMVFKSWIPRLAANRFSKLTYVEGIQSYEMGRYNAMIDVLQQGLGKSISNLYNIYMMNDEGVTLLKNMYEERQVKYAERTGEELDISKLTRDQYMEMMQSMIQGSWRDALAAASILAIALAWGAALPPEDDQSKGAYRYMSRLLEKSKNEMFFYYNPMEWVRITNGSLFPSAGVVSEMFKVSQEIGKTVVHLTTGDEELEKKTHLYKATSKIFPILNQTRDFIAVLDNQLAKELDVEIKK